MNLRRKRHAIFKGASLVVAAANLAIGVLCHYIWSGEWGDPYLRDALLPTGLLWPSAASVVTALTYLLSLDSRASRRPRFFLFVLFASFFLMISGYIMGSRQVTLDNFPVFIGAAVASLALAGLFLFLESVLGGVLTRMAGPLCRSDKPAAGLWLQRLGLAWRPGDGDSSLNLGLAFAGLGRYEEARPHIETAYDAGDHSLPLVRALFHIYLDAGEKARAAKFAEMLYEAEPSPDLFKRLIILWEETGQKRLLLDTLDSLPAEERAHYLEKMRDLAFELGDRDRIRDLAQEFERDGPPFTRAKWCYSRLLESDARDTAALRALLRLAKRVNDWHHVGDLLEKLVAIHPNDASLRRELLEHYRFQNEPDAAFRQLIMLVASGQATLAEKLEAAEQHFAVADYDEVEKLISSDDELANHPRSLCLLAETKLEMGLLEEAEELISQARELDPDAETTVGLGSVEAKIRAKILERDLEVFAQRVEQNPGDLDLKFEYFDRLAAAGKADLVVISLEDLLAHQPSVAQRVVKEVEGYLGRHGFEGRLARYLSDLHAREGRWDECFAVFERMAGESLHPAEILREAAERILATVPDHVPSLLALTRVSHETGRHAEALACLDRLAAAGFQITRDMRLIEFESGLAVGDLSRAAAAGSALLSETPDDKDLLMRIAQMEADLGRYDSAIRHLKHARAVHPDDHTIALLLRRVEDQRKSARMEEIRRRLETHPRDDGLLEELGDLHHDFSQLNEAIVAYQRAAHARPDNQVARAKLGYVLARKEMFSDAEETFAEVILSVEQDDHVQTRLKALFYKAAEVAEDENQFDLALALYKRVFRVDAGYRDVVTRIERLERLAKGKKA
ncbi:MAG: tetratricopeptide repeat protein [Candidatus Sumerlaeaceae bacterium]|nr:tetratricopeptide repeat protein [Candidatus Sumerlaeaceae bacterium]